LARAGLKRQLARDRKLLLVQILFLAALHHLAVGLAVLLTVLNHHGNPVVMVVLAVVRLLDLATVRREAQGQRAATTVVLAAIMALLGLALVAAGLALLAQTETRQPTAALAALD
jgi:hypothetical protein